MEKMPYQVALDTHAPDVDWSRSLVPIGSERCRRCAASRSCCANCATVRCGVALRSPDDRGSVALHLAAADARSRASSGSSRGRTVSGRPATYVCFAVTLHGFDTAIGIFQVRQLEPGFEHRRMGLRDRLAPSGAPACSRTARSWCSTSRSRRSASHRLEARAAIANGRGNGALRKIGAVQEGILRKSFLKDGEYLDQALYAVTDMDWRGSRAPIVAVPSVRVH